MHLDGGQPLVEAMYGQAETLLKFFNESINLCDFCALTAVHVIWIADDQAGYTALGDCGLNCGEPGFFCFAASGRTGHSHAEEAVAKAQADALFSIVDAEEFLCSNGIWGFVLGHEYQELFPKSGWVLLRTPTFMATNPAIESFK